MNHCVKLSTKINSLDYNMGHSNRGFCVIFDNENFEKLPRRHGSQRDSTGLYNLFRAMSFDVKIYKDRQYKDIKKILEYYSRLDHGDRDCFVCCILTHGEHGTLWATDAKFPIDTMFTYFLGHNCRSLVGKPKIFFVQACQGDRLDDGVAVVSREAEDSSTACYSIPTHADFLIAYSTIPGFFSWRNTQDGSWFMQAVIAVFQEYHQEADLLTMLTMVNHRVAFFKSSNADTEEYNRKKQVPCITSMLTRRVFLRPKPMFLHAPQGQPQITGGELRL